jgi:hypothetical protein
MYQRQRHGAPGFSLRKRLNKAIWPGGANLQRGLIPFMTSIKEAGLL